MNTRRNYLLRILSIFLAFVLCAISTQFVFAAAKLQNEATYYYRNQLNQEELLLYNALQKHVLKSPGVVSSGAVKLNPPIRIEDGASLTSSELSQRVSQRFQKAMDAFRMDHPEAFWLNNSTRISYTLADVNGALFIHDITGEFQSMDLSPQEIQHMNNTISEIVLLAGRHSSPSEQLKILHDTIIQRITYGYGKNPVRAHQAVGLIDGKGVCEAYAKSFKMAADRLGIPVITVGGAGINASTGKSEEHMWNYVLLEGKWYLIDLTWNDYNEIISYTYFLVGGQNASKYHLPATQLHNIPYVTYKGFIYPTLASATYQ